ncbi:unnamed protein product [Durusdinium trenchii]|uniref:Uncharacterized protein n=1 Tax=Durusdinium trenchii TaxID=1381693 RepID=A0ABP0IQJ4_9DINO
MTIPPAPHTDELTPCLARYDRFQHGESCFAASHVDTEVRPELPASLRETAGTNHGSFLYLEPSKENFLYKHSNCWICGDWVEVVFEATVADLPQLGDDVTCSALVSIDNFSQPVPLTPSRHGLWRGSRFLPPTERLLVIFRVGEELCTHPKLPVRTLQRPLQVPNRGDGSVCGEVNVLRVADLAEAFCLGVPPEGAAHVCGSAALCGGALHGPRLTSSTKAVS